MTDSNAKSTSSPEKSGDDTLMSVAFIKRNPALTHDEFYHHWEKIHGPLVKPWAEKHGFVGYTQVHLKPVYAEGVPIGPENNEPSPLESFDGCALMEIKSFDQFAAAFKDEYYINHIEPDERKFIDKKVGVLRARGEVKRII